MDPSDDQSYGKCDDSDDDISWFNRKTEVLLKKEPGVWIAGNRSRLWEVINLKLELPDHVYSISDSIGDLLNLKHLIIKRGNTFSCLPHTLPSLLHLSWLQLENCPNLSQLPSNFGNLFALRVLTIRNCGIKSLPHSLSLVNLLFMELNNCNFIQELPASLHVETLRLVGSHVKSFSAKPHHLGRLEINNCLYVDDILTSLNHFDSLGILLVQGYDMESLPNSITVIHNLESLEIKDCMKLKRLPQNLIQLADLYGLTLVNCGLESIPSGLRRLGRLSIENCLMEFLFIKEFVSLIYVTLKSCNINSLDGCITGLTKLKRLSIHDCVALEDLPSDINTLVSLETLCIEGCTSIKFPPHLAALHNLSCLSLKGCSRLDELPADFDELTNLESLYLTDTNVQSLPSVTIAKLPDLKYVHLPCCFRLETLPNDFDLKGIQIFLPPSFRLDTLPAKFLVRTIFSSYQLHLKDQKESSLELIHDKECDVDVDVDVADKSNKYWQTMVKTPLNLAHLPQPRPGKDKHIMNYSRVMSQHESRDSESVDSSSGSVTSKALSKEVTSLLRTEKRTMGREFDDGHRMKQRKSQLGTRDRRCKSILSARQDGMFLMYTVWAKHKENEINFKFKPKSTFAELKQELAERLPLEGGKLKIKYLDAPENLGKGDPNASIVRDWVLMTCDADLRHCERYSLGMKIWLIVQENQDGRS